jgi:hypothetical protein
MLWYRVQSACIPWMAPDNPFHAKPQSIDYTIARDCIVCILAARRCKPAHLIRQIEMFGPPRIEGQIVLVETDGR